MSIEFLLPCDHKDSLIECKIKEELPKLTRDGKEIPVANVTKLGEFFTKPDLNA